MNRFQKFINGCDDIYKSFYQERLDSWSAATVKKAISLAEALERIGCKEPEPWVFSEIDENIPQVARYALLTTLRDRVIQSAVENDFWLPRESEKVLISRIDEHFTPSEKLQLFGAIANSILFSTLNTLDEGSHGDDNVPGWVVVERNCEGEVTERDLGGLHESWYEIAESNGGSA